MREPLLTDRLILRDITVADAEALVALDSDPMVMRYLGGVTQPDLQACRERIRDVHMAWQLHSWHGTRIVFDRSTGGFLGWVFIRPSTASRMARDMDWTRPDEIEVGYRYHQHAWGRGIATEAAALMVRIALADAVTSAIVGNARVDNTGSLRVLAKLGLQRVGEVVLPGASEATVKLARGR